MSRLVSAPRLFYYLPVNPYLTLYMPPANIPLMTTYILGNPLIAKTMFPYDFAVALHVPTRLFITQILSPTGMSILLVIREMTSEPGADMRCPYFRG